MLFAKKVVLREPLQELLTIQNQLCQQSTYYGALLQERLGTDTIPLLCMTVDGEVLFVDNTCFFRLEKVEENLALLRLLRAHSAEGEVTGSLKEAVYLMKTEQVAVLSLHTIAAIQLSHLPLQEQLYIESKW